MTHAPYDTDDYEPSAAARKHAEEMQELYASYQTLAGMLQYVTQKLIDHGAAQPFIISHHRDSIVDGRVVWSEKQTSVAPEEGIEWLENIVKADYSRCRDENEAEFDRVDLENSRERQARLQDGD